MTKFNLCNIEACSDHADLHTLDEAEFIKHSNESKKDREIAELKSEIEGLKLLLKRYLE